MGIRKASKKDQTVEKSCPDMFFDALIRNRLLPFPLSKLPNWLFWKQACSGWVAVGDVSIWENLLRLFGSLLRSLTRYSCFFFKFTSLSCPFGFAWFPLGSGLAVSRLPAELFLPQLSCFLSHDCLAPCQLSYTKYVGGVWRRESKQQTLVFNCPGSNVN